MSMPAAVSPAQRNAEPSMEEILASIRKIIAEDQKALDAKHGEPMIAAPLESAPAVNDDEADDVLDLGTVAQSEPVAPPVAAVVAPVVQPPVVEEVAAAQAPVAAPAMSDRLISDVTAQSAGAAFHSLANTVFSQQARTMDDLVSEMLRPMLSNWLDEHLPSLVERLVKAEIERVARGGR